MWESARETKKKKNGEQLMRSSSQASGTCQTNANAKHANEEEPTAKNQPKHPPKCRDLSGPWQFFFACMGLRARCSVQASRYLVRMPQHCRTRSSTTMYLPCTLPLDLTLAFYISRRQPIRPDTNILSPIMSTSLHLKRSSHFIQPRFRRV